MADRKPAVLFQVGEYIVDELVARKMPLSEFVIGTGLTVEAMLAIIGGRMITNDDAAIIGKRFGTGPEIWLNLQRSSKP